MLDKHLSIVYVVLSGTIVASGTVASHTVHYLVDQRRREMYGVIDRVGVVFRDYLDRWLGLQVRQSRHWAADTSGYAPEQGDSMVCSRCAETRVEVDRLHRHS